MSSYLLGAKNTKYTSKTRTTAPATGMLEPLDRPVLALEVLRLEHDGLLRDRHRLGVRRIRADVAVRVSDSCVVIAGHLLSPLLQVHEQRASRTKCVVLLATTIPFNAGVGRAVHRHVVACTAHVTDKLDDLWSAVSLGVSVSHLSPLCVSQPPPVREW